MAVVRSYAIGRAIERGIQVVEPEMDMNRLRPEASTAGRIATWLRWLIPSNQEVAGPPRRAIARELEEVWPSDR